VFVCSCGSVNSGDIFLIIMLCVWLFFLLFPPLFASLVLRLFFFFFPVGGLFVFMCLFK